MCSFCRLFELFTTIGESEDDVDSGEVCELGDDGRSFSISLLIIICCLLEWSWAPFGFELMWLLFSWCCCCILWWWCCCCCCESDCGGGCWCWWWLWWWCCWWCGELLLLLVGDDVAIRFSSMFFWLLVFRFSCKYWVCNEIESFLFVVPFGWFADEVDDDDDDEDDEDDDEDEDDDDDDDEEGAVYLPLPNMGKFAGDSFDLLLSSATFGSSFMLDSLIRPSSSSIPFKWWDDDCCGGDVVLALIAALRAFTWENKRI